MVKRSSGSDRARLREGGEGPRAHEETNCEIRKGVDVECRDATRSGRVRRGIVRVTL